MSYKRTVENFICDHCGREVAGNGYTNHCPRCLWSKHADINPGDRAAVCLGLMEPSSVEVTKGEYKITHKCARCGFIRKQLSAKEDDIDRLVELSTQQLFEEP